MAIEWAERWLGRPDNAVTWIDDRGEDRREIRIDMPKPSRLKANPQGFDRGRSKSIPPVVRRFLRDDDVVDVAFAEAGRG